MTNYRVQYTEVKPGGTRVQQDIALNGTPDDVTAYLDRYQVLGGSVIVTEYTESDSVGTLLPGSW